MRIVVDFKRRGGDSFSVSTLRGFWQESSFLWITVVFGSGRRRIFHEKWRRLSEGLGKKDFPAILSKQRSELSIMQRTSLLSNMFPDF